LSVPKRKFVRDIIYGILASKSVQLASIGRSLKEKIDLKKTCERLTRNLAAISHLEQRQIMKTHALSLERRVEKYTPVIIDHTDLSKTYAKKMEGLSYVWDGSQKKAHRQGYCICEAAVLDKNSQVPVSVYTDLYSYKSASFLSTNDHLFQAFQFLQDCYGNKGIYTMDRGMDDKKVYSYLDQQGLFFSVRMVGNRHVLTKALKDKENAGPVFVKDLAQNYKGRYSVSFKAKNGKTRQIYYSAVPVQLPALPERWFCLIIVKGYSHKPLLLLTNPDSMDKDVLLHFIMAYIARWNIEEIFRYRKVCTKLEAIQVRSLKRIIVLNLLAMLASAYTAIICLSQAHRHLFDFIFLESRRERQRASPFPKYAMADGIYTIFFRLGTGIKNLLPLRQKKPPLQQLVFPQVLQLRTFLIC
jgi:hypothetical protein